MARSLFRLPARLGIDVIMTLLFVTSLAFRATERAPHEWIGITLCVLFGIHVYINWGWYASIFKGRYTPQRMLNTVINFALIAIMGFLCVTGILNSRHLFGFSQYFDGESIRQMHSFAAYWGLALIGIHVGLHWKMLLAALRKASGKNLESKTAMLAIRGLAILIAAYGVWAFFDRDMGLKLFLGFSFDFWDSARPLVFFYTSNLGILGVYAFITHYARQGLEQAFRKMPQPQCSGQ